MAMHALEADLAERVAALRPWFHSHDLGGGRMIERDPVYASDPTYPLGLWRRVEPLIPASLAGSAVLDVGCNSGYFSARMKERGAGRVVGVESFPLFVEQARLVSSTLALELELHRASVYEVTPALGSFDLTLFLGVLYHLRHPLLALEKLAAVTKGLLVLESAILPEIAPSAPPPPPPPPPWWLRWRLPPPLPPPPAPPPRILPDYGGKPHEVLFLENDDASNPEAEGLQNWFIPSMGAFVAMVKAVGFDEILHAEAHVDRGIVVARRPRQPGRRSSESAGVNLEVGARG